MKIIRKKTALILLGVLGGLFFLWVGCRMPEVAGHFLAWRVHFGTRGKVQLVAPQVFLSGEGVRIAEVRLPDWQQTPFAFSLREVRIQPVMAAGKNQFLVAVASQGQLGGGKSKSVQVSGRVTGNLLSGTYEVPRLEVQIEGIGKVNLSGWVDINGEKGWFAADLSRISLNELCSALGLETIPVTGSVNGNCRFLLQHQKEEWKIERLEYRLTFQHLAFPPQNIAPLDGKAEGFYDLIQQSGQVKEALFTTPSGGRLTLSGTIGTKGFDLLFEGAGLQLEEILEALPPAVKSKMGLKVEEVAGKVYYEGENGTLNSEAAFRFFQAAGNGRFSASHLKDGAPIYSGMFNLRGLDLLALSAIYGEGAVISGIANLETIFRTEEGKITYLRAALETVPKAGIRQYFNVHALRYLLALASSPPPLHFLTAGDYGYRKLGLAVTYQNDSVTIEGLARRERGKEFILLGTIFGRTVNLMVDPTANTVGIEDLKNRLAHIKF